jgi:hypothetical protein
VRSTAAPYTESRLTRSVANERVGFPVVEHIFYKHVLYCLQKVLDTRQERVFLCMHENESHDWKFK